MATTDTRIIEMRFENQQFERNIAKSTKSVEDLKAAMDFEQTSSGLSKFVNSIDSLDFSKLTDNVQKLTDKFTGLGTLSELVMSQIRRSIEQTAAKVSSFVDSMTTQQISEGKSKYEMLNKSVQTIMAATGKGEEEVYSVLSRLNDYTDQTSYNFSDMVSNIGKFTSVGIDLQSAEQQMEGIANWAARSGAGITEASRAMYNLSQAMGVGKLTKIDWKSIETAGMATKEFKEQLIQAGLAAGTLEKDSKGVVKTASSLGKQVAVTFENVSDTLSKGWASKEVLSNTLLGYYYDDLYYEGTSVAQKLSDEQKNIFNTLFEDANTISKEGWKKLSENGPSDNLDKAAESAKNLTKELTAVNEQGERYGRGNIDLNKRKIVKNDDGSISTELSFSVEIDGKQVLLPTVIDGKIVNEKEAIEHFEETGEHLGMFDTIKEAEEYAQRLHEIQDLYYNNDKSFEGIEELNEALGEQALISDETRQKLLDVAIEQGNLTKTVTKDGKTVYKTTDKIGKDVTFTMDKLEESLDAGWLTRDVAKMVWGFDTLAEDSYKAAQKCTTFTDVLQAWKDQLSTGWMTTYRLLFGDLSESMEFFSNVCDKVGDALSELVDFRNGILKSWSSSGGRNSLFEIILGSYGDDVESDAYGLIDIILDAGNLIKNAFWDFVELFLPENLRKTWSSLSTEGKNSFIGVTLSRFTAGIQESLQNLRAFFDEGIQVGNGTKSRLQMIRETILVFAAAMKLAYDVIYGFIGFVSEIAAQLSDSFDAILGFLSTLGLTIYHDVDEMGKAQTIPQFFHDLAESLRPLTSSVNFVITKLTELLNMFLMSGGASTMSQSLFGMMGSYLQQAFSYASRVIGPMLTFIGDALAVLKDLFAGGFGEESLTKAGETLKASLNTMIASMPQSVQTVVAFFKDLYDRIKEAIKTGFNKESMEKLGKTFTDFGQTVLGKLPEGLKTTAKTVLKKLETFFTDLWSKVVGFLTGKEVLEESGETKNLTVFGTIADQVKSGYNKLSSYVSTITDSVEGKTTTLWEAVKNLNWSKIVMILLGGLATAGIVTLVVKAIATVKLIAKAIKLVGDILTGEKAIFPKLFKTDDEKVTDFGSKMLKIAGAIALVAAALILIGNMKLENALQGIGALIVIVGLLVGASFLLKNAYKSVNWQEALGMFAGLYGMGLAIALIAKAILPIANVNFGGFLQIIGVLVTIFAGLIVLSAMAAEGNMSFAKMGGILGVAAGIALLIFSLRTIANMNLKQIVTMMGTLAFIFGELIGFIWAIHKTSLAGKELGQLAAVAAAIALLIIALKRIANMNPGQIATMMVTLFVILGELVAFIWAVQKVSLEGKGLIQLAAVAASIALIMFALLPVALLPFWKLVQGVAAVGLILAGLVLATKSLGNGAITLAGSGLVQLLALAGAVVLISLALIPLSLLDFWSMMGAVAAVSYIIIMLGAMVVAANKFPAKPSSMVGLLAVAGSIALLVIALTPLALMDWEGLKKMGASLLVVVLAMVAMLAVTKNVKASAIASTSLLMAVMSLMILSLGAAMHDLKGMDWKVINAFTTGLGILVLAVSAAALIAGAIGLKGFAILAAGLTLVLAAVALMVPVLLRSISSGMRDAAANMTIVADLMSSFSDKMDNVDEGSYDKAERVINKLTSIISQMVGIVFTGGSTTVFRNCMAELSLAASEMVKLDTKMSRVSADGSMGKLGVIVGGLEGLFDDHLSKFGEYLTYAGRFYSVLYKLGSGIDYFQSMTTDLPDAEENQGLKLIKELAACAPNLDTIYKMDLDTFRRQLSLLGGAMIVYAEGAASVNGGEINDDTDVSGAITLLHKIADSFAQDGGFSIPENMPTSDALTDFGDQLAALAGALVAFEKAGAGLGKGTNQALATIDFFAKLKERLTKTTNFGTGLSAAINSFKDENGEFIQKDELTTFGEDIAQLGSSMKHFAEATQYTDEGTGEIKPIDFSKATDALDAIVSLQDKLPSFGGVLQFIAGEKEDLGKLSTDLELLGDAISDFYNSTTTVTDGVPEPMNFGTDTTGVIGFLNSISDIQNKLPRVKGFNLTNLIYSEGTPMSFGDLGQQLVLLGSDLKILSEAVTGTNADGEKNFDIDAATTATDYLTNSVLPLMQQLARDLPTVGGLWNILSTALGTGREFTLQDLSTQLSSLGDGLGALGEGLNKGSWSDSSGAKNAFDALDSILEVMVHLQSFYTALQADPLSGGTAGAAFQNLSDFLSFFAADGIVTQGKQVYPIVDQIASFIMAVDTALTGWADENDDTLEHALTRMELFKTFTEGLNALTTSNLTADWKFIGNKVTTDVATAIAGGTASVSEAMQTLLTSTYTSSENVPGVIWSVLGTNIALGIETGVKTAGPTHVTTAVRQMMVDAYNAGKQAIRSNSPSKLFMELGNYMGEGTAIGIEKSTDDVGENAGLMGEVALDKARDMIALISAVMAEDTNASPTISPILDLTNLEEGMAQFKAGLTGYSVTLDTSGAVNRAGNTNGSTSGTSTTQTTVDLSGIYARMEQMNTKIASLGSSIAQMKLVLDSGVIAGEVSASVDAYLGRQKFYANRRN